MAEFEQVGNEAILAQDESWLSLLRECERLSAQVALEQLSTWSMLETLKHQYPQFSEEKVVQAALSALEEGKRGI